MRRFLLLLAFASIARADLSFKRVAIPENVPADLCTALVQDAKGFLWIGTQRGLVRFDGTNFKTYDQGYVRALYAARDGRLLVGTYGGGFSVFHPESETFTKYRVSHDRVEAVMEDAQGRMCAATFARNFSASSPPTRRSTKRATTRNSSPPQRTIESDARKVAFSTGRHVRRIGPHRSAHGTHRSLPPRCSR